MRLILLSLISIYFSHTESILGQIKEREHYLNLKEGIIIFCKQDTADKIPMDIVFIPFVINKSENLAKNLANCLKQQSVGYFMQFQNMRHTQRFLNTHLGKLGAIDTSQYVLSYRLGQAFNEVKLIEAKSSLFPSVSNSCINDCDIGVSAGAIIFDERLIAHFKTEVSYSDTPLISTFILNVNDNKSVVKYYEFSYSFSLGMSLSFVPIYLSNE